MEIDSGAAASSSATTAAAGFAAANKLDMPLDQLISANRQARRRQRRPTGGRQPGGQQQQQQQQKPYQRRPVAANAKKSGVVAKALTPAPDVGSKIIVSNLHFGVTESDLRELFSTMGALKKVSLSFDATGKSKGVAEIVFVRRPDAISAVKKYNNVALDGRPMKMEMTTPAVSVLDRIAPVNASVAASNTAGRLGAKQQSRQRQRNRRVRGPRQQPKTADQLDADMDSYMEAAQ